MKIKQLEKPPNIQLTLPASKSISNRVLILNALCETKANLHNLSEARDTKTMLRLLAEEEETLDVLDAGTTMRFLTAYLAVDHWEKTLTGTKRMQERPIGILVEALRTIGGNVDYLGKEGYPPLRIKPFKTQKSNHIKIRGDVSSQYISALLMVAPTLPQGLAVELTGRIASRPYIEMTIRLMKHFGVEVEWGDAVIRVSPQKYVPTEYTVEPDWSGASYWYGIVALAQDAEVLLTGFREDSLQGDKAIAEIGRYLGVKTDFLNPGIRLTKTDAHDFFEYDFFHCPDLAQTVAVTCAAKGIRCTMTGLESLKIKETDRVAALQNELLKIGGDLREEGAIWHLIPSNTMDHHKETRFKTYEDHRMAMAFAPLATKMNIEIEDPQVVEKSYPSFWRDMEKAGFETFQLSN